MVTWIYGDFIFLAFSLELWYWDFFFIIIAMSLCVIWKIIGMGVKDCRWGDIYYFSIIQKIGNGLYLEFFLLFGVLFGLRMNFMLVCRMDMHYVAGQNRVCWTHCKWYSVGLGLYNSKFLCSNTKIHINLQLYSRIVLYLIIIHDMIISAMY